MSSSPNYYNSMISFSKYPHSSRQCIRFWWQRCMSWGFLLLWRCRMWYNTSAEVLGHMHFQICTCTIIILWKAYSSLWGLISKSLSSELSPCSHPHHKCSMANKWPQRHLLLLFTFYLPSISFRSCALSSLKAIWWLTINRIQMKLLSWVNLIMKHYLDCGKCPVVIFLMIRASTAWTNYNPAPFQGGWRCLASLPKPDLSVLMVWSYVLSLPLAFCR